MGAKQGERVTAGGTAFVENNQFRMKVVGERNGKKKQNERAGKSGAFAQRIAAAFGTVVQPPDPPEAKSYGGDCHPQ